MATPKSQRIAIWVIAIVMAIGAVGTYFVVILANNNQQSQYEQALKAQQDAEKQRQKYTASLRPLDGYTNEAFDAASVTSLVTEDLVAGTGKEVTKNATIKANYTGWTADGKIFDSTNSAGTTEPRGFSLDKVIPGWTEGLVGAKEGTVRKLVIPTDKAYGADAASYGYPAGPLTFIVQIVEVK